MKRPVHLNVNILNAGVFGGSWRYPGTDPLASFTVEHYVNIARTAERAAFDAVFLADGPGVREDLRYRPFNNLEPTVVLTAIAAATARIGLIGTLSSTYNDPHEVARRLATLDLITGGRAGWNVVTTAGADVAANFGLDDEVEHTVRYRRAAEFVETVRTLWQSGPRSPQGEPVIVQAGASSDGRALAAAVGEVIFTAAQTIPDAREYPSTSRAAPHCWAGARSRSWCYRGSRGSSVRPRPRHASDVNCSPNSSRRSTR
jgi:alkanesulfonate monooxygenase SsuD/methylene tetrahydromethanopterin reductase-like flavin-dependent oxidoreductase (luciferase family)